MNRIVGILGGMGPQATLDLMSKVIDATPVTVESDHVHMLVDCNPTVPNRTAALLEAGESPGPELARMARGLVAAGADVLAMPCNTAHAFLGDITAAVSVPVLDMIELTADGVPGGVTVGLLATPGTRRSRLYHDRLEARGLRVVDLDADDQERLDGLVQWAKTRPVGKAQRAALTVLIDRLAAHGARAIIAGCTEVPLLLPEAPAVAVIDPTTLLARAIVSHCKGAPAG